ncbi:MAG: glycerol-3-phosphate 1-O-acyltransferase PlsY [Methylophilaceae bacterium]|jgi:glycerol-3-phosphate acyltransferase PlsY
MEFTVVLILAYFIGSISFGIVFSKLFKLKDPRSFGSKNIGATNVMRSGKKLPAVLTLLGDLAKGSVMILLCQYLGFAKNEIFLVAGAVFLGHLFPIYHKFKGGKGVATAFGILLIIHSKIALMVLATWIFIFLITRISSLSALSAAIVLPIIAYLMNTETGFIYLSLFLSLMLIYRHKQNIQNLLQRQESKFR